ncbi:S1C family serine protease [Streptomyces sp. NBC_01431]|uniref:S1C family serine protease n=1 Tax=Streptomyces sp. NBC_01431 TaxID=2903863 RepID=UPI002E360611|nr:trypsin-like peptidase domain-containing protein [Streptomyces sp. NBC_01431]
MNEGKPTGPKPKWWSRPLAGRPRDTAPAEPLTETYDLAPPIRPAEASPVAEMGPGAGPVPVADVGSAGGPVPVADAGPAGGSARVGGAGPAGGPVPVADGGPAAEASPVAGAGPAAGSAPVAEPAPLSTVAQGVEAPNAVEQGPSAERHDVPPEPRPAPPAPRQPLHAPDPYGTPPYGGPGPWAPAPPVQRPVPTPPGGTELPSQAAYPAPQAPAQQAPHAAPQAPAQQAPHAAPQAPAQQAPHAAPQAPAQQAPHAVPQAPAPQAAHPAPAAPGSVPAPQSPHPAPQAAAALPPSSQWVQYDPWGASAEPFSVAGQPVVKKRRRGALLAGAVLLALVAGCIGGGVGAYIERNGGITSVHLPQADKEPQGRAPDSVAGIAASALPSVVTLHVTGATESGTGTGFVLDNAGHILTNNHVVEPAGSSGKISVTFSGGESAPAEVVGRDTGYDLAVVKVAGVSGLKPLALGNSDNVLVGDPVVAIGAPFDLSNTVTSGIISAKDRPITAGGEKGDGTDVSYVDALQTDAPINPGNSGGPLVDSKARVIGINSAIRSAGSGSTDGSGGQPGSIGLGFAIPINQGKRVAEELINTGRATHPVIGVTLDMKFTGDGARVGDKAGDGGPAVAANGPGAKAGIKPQDVITKVDGQRVHSGEELIVKIRAHRPGDQLRLTLQRDGKEQELTLTLGSAS